MCLHIVTCTYSLTELLCNRVKLALLFSFVLLLLLYLNACNLRLSTNCPIHPSSSMDYRLSGQLIIDLQQKLNLVGPSGSSKSDNHVGGSHGDHDNEADDSILAPQAVDGQHELEIPTEKRRRQIDMKGMNLNNWDLDRFYSIPHGLREQQKSVQQEPHVDPVVLPKPALEPIKKLENSPKEKANDGNDIVEKPVKTEKVKVHGDDIGKDNSVVVAKKKIFVYQQSPPDKQAGRLRDKDQLDSLVKQRPKEKLNPPDKPLPNVVEELNPPSKQMPEGKKGPYVKPPNGLKGLNPAAGVVRTEADQNAMDAYLKRKAEKKYKKKVIRLLPDTFPYFDNHRPPAKIGNYTCR